MGEFTTLMARDGHEFNAWLTAPRGPARGALVIAQEIFGVNHHIRGVADGYAADGYLVIAPCLFDRIRRGIELGYTEADTQQSIRRIHMSPFVVHKDNVRGFVYDVDTGQLHEVQP